MKEALKLALEALDLMVLPRGFQAQVRCKEAYEAIKEAMAQPEQEPVAWESLLGAVARGWCYEENANKTMDSDLAVAIAKEVQALYTTPPQRKPLKPVEGDLLPAIGSKVLIHLARQDEWVEHTVVGYYVWGDLDGLESRMHRVFVRVADAGGILNARRLCDVRPVEAAHGIKGNT